jgi:hypothetical protein
MMNKKTFLKLAAVFLLILGVGMLFLGIRGKTIPPSITGVGFIIIGIVFWNQSQGI